MHDSYARRRLGTTDAAGLRAAPGIVTDPVWFGTSAKPGAAIVLDTEGADGGRPADARDAPPRVGPPRRRIHDGSEDWDALAGELSPEILGRKLRLPKDAMRPNYRSYGAEKVKMTGWPHDFRSTNYAWGRKIRCRPGAGDVCASCGPYREAAAVNFARPPSPPGSRQPPRRMSSPPLPYS